MSRVLVIPDVHLKPWIFDMADRVDESSHHLIKWIVRRHINPEVV